MGCMLGRPDHFLKSGGPWTSLDIGLGSLPQRMCSLCSRRLLRGSPGPFESDAADPAVESFQGKEARVGAVTGWPLCRLLLEVSGGRWRRRHLDEVRGGADGSAVG